MAFFVFHFSGNVIGYFKQALKYDWLCCFSVSFSLVRERCDSEQKIVRFVNKLHCREPVRCKDHQRVLNGCHKFLNASEFSYFACI